MSKILAVIPARGGSKRVPRKNKKTLCDKALISWSIETAVSVMGLKVMVSTDDQETAEIACQNGAEVPFMRSSHYATDESSVLDAILEVIEHYQRQGEEFEGVLLLQPTSPFRTRKTIEEAIGLYKKFGGDSVVSVSAAKAHPYWCKRIIDDTLYPFDDNYDASTLRSQELPKVYQLNGVIYLASIETLQTRRSFYSQNTRSLLIDSEEESLDIDTPFDWLVAETIASRGSGKK